MLAHPNRARKNVNTLRAVLYVYSITIQKLPSPCSKSERKHEPTSQVGVGRGPQGRTQHPVNSKPLLIPLEKTNLRNCVTHWK